MPLRRDFEMTTINRIMIQLAALDPPARHRVMAYILARLDDLPMAAQVTGAVPNGDDQPALPLDEDVAHAAA